MLNRRAFHQTLVGGGLAGGLLPGSGAAQSQTYEANWDSLGRHPLPAWYSDAKFGIFIHWGLYSVPAWAEPSGELGKVDWNQWFYRNAYAEWYLNSIRLKESSAWKHHVATYGAEFDYYDFAKTFNREVAKWHPEVWAKLFKSIGARYVVLTSKHHDGFPLWPTRVVNPRLPAQAHVSRDILGDLAKAVRNEGLHMAFYYSGGLDWTFSPEPIAHREDLKKTAPQSEEYARYADAHWRELIGRYQPAILWNDISYPKLGKLTEIVSDYYNKYPDGLINNRFSAPFADFTTPEYAKYDTITPKKWESCRGLGFSFGYNQIEGPEQVIAPDQLIALLVDIVSKNGNLLLNIGPKPDGTISAIQMDRLEKLGAWLRVNGDAIFGTKPWIRPAAKTATGEEVRYTQKGETLYAILLTPPASHEAVIPELKVAEQARIVQLGSSAPLKWTRNDQGISISLNHPSPPDRALALAITPAPQA